MDHSHMDHSMHGMGMDMGGDRCNMNMLFTWDTTNLCIIFRWWHIRSTLSLFVSLVGIVAITAGFEAIRGLTHRYESWLETQKGSITRRNQEEVGKRAHVVKAALYALQSFYAFMLMLLFMTYNGWVMIAVGVGAFVGFLAFGKNTSASKEGVCH